LRSGAIRDVSGVIHPYGTEDRPGGYSPKLKSTPKAIRRFVSLWLSLVFVQLLGEVLRCHLARQDKRHEFGEIIYHWP
jgi:hypothetical protein